MGAYDKVHAGKLLEHLKEDTEHDTAEVARRRPATPEAVNPAGLHVLTLVTEVGDKLGKLRLDVLRISGLTTDPGQSAGSLLKLIILDEVAGRLGQAEKTTAEDDGPGELDGDWNAVRARVHAVLSGLVDARGEEKTNGNGELVAGDDGTTNGLGGDLRHVENDGGGNEADANTSDETASNKQIDGSGSDLENDTDGEDDTAGNNGGATTNPVGEGTSKESTEEGTGGEDGGDQRLLPGVVEVALVGIVGVGGARVAKLALEVVHTQHARDVSRVIAEEDTYGWVLDTGQ